MTKISPSILAGDFINLAKELTALKIAGADLLHLDVMDGHFVPNLTFGPPVIRAMKSVSSLPFDVHLMIDGPECYLDDYIDAGADFLTLHVEACTHLERALRHIKKRGVKAGVALNPSTHHDAIEYVADILDLVLVMAVNPGFCGQEFLPNSIKKVGAIKKLLERQNNKACLISVDGGVDSQNATLLRDAGANVLVSGSYIFKSSDYGAAIKSLR